MATSTSSATITGGVAKKGHIVERIISDNGKKVIEEIKRGDKNIYAINQYVIVY